MPRGFACASREHHPHHCVGCSPHKRCRMHGRHLLRAGLSGVAWLRGRTRGGAPVCWETQLVSSRGASTNVSAAAEAPKPGEQSRNFRARRFVLPAAALVAVSSAAVASSQHEPLSRQDVHPSSSLEAPWIQSISQQQDVLQVLSAESISTHPLLSQDHLVGIMPSLLFGPKPSE